jgi:hypothetical protein
MTPLKDINPLTPLTIRGSRAGLTRREAMQWVLAAAGASALPTGSGSTRAFAQEEARRPILTQEDAAKQPDPLYPGGYGSDPKLVPPHKPGEYWPLTLDDKQKKIATVLADAIIPADDYGPAASTVGVVAMIDEWISAPYPQQKGDRGPILEGLTWLDAHSMKRFGEPFAGLAPERIEAICDDICYEPSAKDEFKKAASFFNRFRNLCAGAYYATPAGWKAIGYIGNVPLVSFDGPPPEVLAKLGVEQTVK